MKLSDTGYLSLWFWMSSVWLTAAAQQLRSSCPACLSQNTLHSFFFFLTSCRILDYYLSGSSWSSLWVTFPLITICLEWCQDGLCNRFKPRGLGNSGLWVNVTVVKYRSKTVRWWTWKGTKVWWCPKRAAGRWVTNLDLLISYFNLVFVWVGFNRIVNLKAT